MFGNVKQIRKHSLSDTSCWMPPIPNTFQTHGQVKAPNKIQLWSSSSGESIELLIPMRYSKLWIKVSNQHLKSKVRNESSNTYFELSTWHDYRSHMLIDNIPKNRWFYIYHTIFRTNISKQHIESSFRTNILNTRKKSNSFESLMFTRLHWQSFLRSL